MRRAQDRARKSSSIKSPAIAWASDCFAISSARFADRSPRVNASGVSIQWADTGALVAEREFLARSAEGAVSIELLAW
jgi:hypothetical protein